jgi:anti-sigma factor ChrR (cupin superfamily)
MKHAALTDQCIERAALYALGALTQIEAQSFEEHLDEGCEVCRRELDEYQFTVKAMAVATPDENPSLTVRNRLLASVGATSVSPEADIRAANEAAPPMVSPLLSIYAGDNSWEEVANGMFVKPLHVDDASGLMTSLVRMMPGVALPPHKHIGVEQFLILEGDCIVDGEQLGPGDYHRAIDGSVHESTYTVNGTTFLLVAPKEYRVLEAR